MADTILIEVIDLYTWEPLQRNSRAQRILRELDKKKVDELLEGFAYYVLNFLKSLVLNAIRYQKFPVRYQPLSPQYQNLKRRRGWKPGFYEMTGFLQQHISVWKNSTRNYCIGFKHGIVHPVNGQPLDMIVKALEMGVPKKGLPARPLWMPFATGVSKHIFDVHWKKYLRTAHPAIFKQMEEG